MFPCGGFIASFFSVFLFLRAFFCILSPPPSVVPILSSLDLLQSLVRAPRPILIVTGPQPSIIKLQSRGGSGSFLRTSEARCVFVCRQASFNYFWKKGSRKFEMPLYGKLHSQASMMVQWPIRLSESWRHPGGVIGVVNCGVEVNFPLLWRPSTE